MTDLYAARQRQAPAAGDRHFARERISLRMLLRQPVLLFVFASICVSLPIVAYHWFPTQDGPAHVNTAVTLRWLASNPTPPLDEIFEARWSLSTNQLAAFALSRLTAWLPLPAAEKLFLVAVVQTFLAVLFWGVYRIAPANLPLALLLVPLTAGYLLHMGFYNFILALPLVLASLVYLHLRFPRFGPGHALLLALLMVATYFAHVIACILLMTAIGTFSVAAGVIETRWPRRSDTGRVAEPSSPFGRSLLELLTCVPAGLLVARDFGDRLTSLVLRDAPALAGAVPPPFTGDAISRAVKLAKGANLMVYSGVDAVFEVALAAVIIALAALKLRSLWRRRALVPADAWLAPVLALLAAYVFLPWDVEGFFQQRVAACLLIVLLIWFVDHTYRARTIVSVASVLLVLNGGLLSWRLWWIGESNQVLAEYAAVADQLPEQTSIFVFTAPPLRSWGRCFHLHRAGLPCRLRPHLHFVGAVIGDRPIANLSNYQAAYRFFPLQFTAAAKDLRTLGNLASGSEFAWERVLAQPQEIEVARQVLGHHRAAYVLFWDEPSAGRRRGTFLRALESVLAGNYRLVWTSRPKGLVRLYVRDEADRTAVAPPGGPPIIYE